MRVNAIISGLVIVIVTIVAIFATLGNLFRGDDGETPDLPETVMSVPDSTSRPRPADASAKPLPPLVVPLIPAAVHDLDGAAGEIEFCLPIVLPHTPCMPRAAILGLDTRPVDRLTADGAPRFAEVMLVHPTDFKEPERVVRTCEVYASLTAEDWAPMTTAGMAAAARFERFCGLRALASVAEVPRTSRFGDGPMTEEEIKAVPAADWPRLGEAAVTEPIFSRAEKEPRSWSGDTETLLMTVRDIAHADFDGDGEGERLLNIAGRARGGSAGFSGYYILEHDQHGIGLRRVDWK